MVAYIHTCINIYIYIYAYIYIHKQIFHEDLPRWPPKVGATVPNGMVWLTGMAGLRQELAMQTPVYNHHKQKWVRSIGHTVHQIDVQRFSWIPWFSISLSVTHVLF